MDFRLQPDLLWSARLLEHHGVVLYFQPMRVTSEDPPQIEDKVSETLSACARSEFLVLLQFEPESPRPCVDFKMQQY